MVNYKKIIFIILLHIISINSFVFSAAKIETEFTQSLNSNLVNAVKSKNKDDVLNLLAKGANVNAQGTRGTPVLSLAIINNNKEIFDLLLQKGASPNFSNIDGRTPLHFAAFHNKDMVEDLLARGADVNSSDIFEQTALRNAAYIGNKELVKLLIDRGAKVNVTDNHKMTPLIIAVYQDHDHLPQNIRNNFKETAEILIKAGADINAIREDDDTALLLAITNGDIEIVKLLLAAGSDLNHAGLWEKNALDLAKYIRGNDSDLVRKNKPIIAALIETEPERREKVIAAWNKIHSKEVAKKIQDSTMLIPDISSIIAYYTQIDKYEDLPLDYRLASINE